MNSLVAEMVWGHSHVHGRGGDIAAVGVIPLETGGATDGPLLFLSGGCLCNILSCG